MSGKTTHRSWLFRIQDMIDHIGEIQEYLQYDSIHSFQNENYKQKAVERYFEIIGEAARYVPEDIREKYQSIEWNKIIGTRNKIAHDYLGVSSRLLWEIYENKLEPLKQDLIKLLQEENQ